MCRFVLHEMNRGFAYCMSNTNRASMSGPIIEGVFGGVERVILLLGYLPAPWLPVCNTTQLSHAVPNKNVPWKSKAEHTTRLTERWPFFWVATVHCHNLSLPLPPHLCLSLLCTVFVSHVVKTARTGRSVCSCRILLPVGVPANTQMNTVKNAS